jgi:hypothetical protein
MAKYKKAHAIIACGCGDRKDPNVISTPDNPRARSYILECPICEGNFFSVEEDNTSKSAELSGGRGYRTLSCLRFGCTWEWDEYDGVCPKPKDEYGTPCGNPYVSVCAIIPLDDSGRPISPANSTPSKTSGGTGCGSTIFTLFVFLFVVVGFIVFI